MASVRITGSELVPDPETGKEYRAYFIEHEEGGVVTKSTHRYSEFTKLHETIPSLTGTRFPAPKSLFTLSDQAAVDERTATLTDYLTFVMDKVPADERGPVDEFLGINTAVPDVAAAHNGDTTAPVAPPAYQSKVTLNVDPNSAVGRVSVDIKEVEQKTAESKKLSMWALLVILAIVPMIVIVCLVVFAGKGKGSGDDSPTHSSFAPVAPKMGSLDSISQCPLGEGAVALSAHPAGVLYTHATFDGSWHTFCKGALSQAEADTACTSMGYEAAKSVASTTAADGVSPAVSWDCSGKNCATVQKKCPQGEILTLECQGSLTKLDPDVAACAIASGLTANTPARTAPMVGNLSLPAVLILAAVAVAVAAAAGGTVKALVAPDAVSAKPSVHDML